MRVHLVSLPHTQVTRAYDWCAYTAKTRRLAGMLAAHDHELVIYGYGESEQEGGSFVSLGEPEDWDRNEVFGDWDPFSTRWRKMNHKAIVEILDRIEPRDAIAIIAGRCQQPILDEFPGHLWLEPEVGYEGVIWSTQKVFESAAWRHWIYGKNNIADGRAFDTVIPNAFHEDEYTVSPDGGYFLYLGRLTERKGLGVIRELANRYKVITAGQGEGLGMIEHCGIVLGEEKRDIIAGAIAVLVPTTYLEPFGGVAVEAQMSGVPAITTDYGAFPETVEQGVTGFRCNTLQEFFDAAEAAIDIRGESIRKIAIERFSTTTCADKYDQWLKRCELLYSDGWYEVKPKEI